MKNDNLKIKVLGNTPIGVYSYRYNKKLAQDTGTRGGKIFFFKAFHLDGIISKEDLNTSFVNDFLWLTREEAKAMLKKKYWKSLNGSLFLEGMSPHHVNKIIEIMKNLREKKSQSRKIVNQ